jgi:hypothetical protein
VFGSLGILDLSFNEIDPETLAELGHLPKLKSLDLTGNQLRHLPLTLTADDFPALEDLVLDDNKLKSVTPFQAFAVLPRLQFLSLSGNRIEFIPRLVDGAGHESRPELGDDDTEGGVIQAFATLKTLCVTHNRISVASDVLNAGLMPVLEALLLWGNPIASKTVSLPIEIQHELVDRRGIEVESKEPKAVHGPVLPDREDFVRVRLPVLPTIKLGGALAALDQRRPPQYLKWVLSSRALLSHSPHCNLPCLESPIPLRNSWWILTPQVREHKTAVKLAPAAQDRVRRRRPRQRFSHAGTIWRFRHSNSGGSSAGGRYGDPRAPKPIYPCGKYQQSRRPLPDVLLDRARDQRGEAIGNSVARRARGRWSRGGCSFSTGRFSAAVPVTRGAIAQLEPRARSAVGNRSGCRGAANQAHRCRSVQRTVPRGTR